jgi:hypothetical protein
MHARLSFVPVEQDLRRGVRPLDHVCHILAPVRPVFRF